MAVREGLLALIDERPRYGYELKTQFELATGGVWPLNVGQVYTTLDRLERDGLVEMNLTEDDPQANGGPQKLYDLTVAGREALAAWWELTPIDEAPPRDELMLKVMLAIPHSRQRALAVITRQRTALFSQLQQRRRQQRAQPGNVDPAFALAANLITDALIVRSEADLRWLDQCEAQVIAAPDSAFAVAEPNAQSIDDTQSTPI